MTLGEVIPAAGSSPGHDAELAADGLGVLSGTEQLHGAPLVQAVLGKDVPKLNNHLPIGNHLPGTGNKLLLALEWDKNQWDWGEKGKKSFSCRTGKVQEAQIHPEERTGCQAHIQPGGRNLEYFA